MAANQAGNTNYSAATQVTQSIVVNVIGAATTPTFLPVAGTYTTALSVTISDTTTGVTIYYTTNGTTPTTSSTVYSGAIPVTSTETLEAIATATGYSTSAVASAAYIIANPAPAISGLSPAFTNAGGAVFTLTVNGSGFIASSTVYWGASALTTTYVSATQLTAQVPAADIATAGTIAITVQSPAPGGGTSNAWQFEVDTAATGTTGPTITSTTETVTAGSTASYPVTVPTSTTSVSVTCLNLPAGAGVQLLLDHQCGDDHHLPDNAQGNVSDHRGLYGNCIQHGLSAANSSAASWFHEEETGGAGHLAYGLSGAGPAGYGGPQYRLRRGLRTTPIDSAGDEFGLRQPHHPVGDS